jgi:hypothetical protein
MLASFSDYVPLGDLGKIIAACLVVAVIAPTAVSVAVTGLDVRASSAEQHRSGMGGTALVVLGVGVLAALIALGIYALFTD